MDSRDAERMSALDGLPAEEEPPAALERRVAAALQERGLLRRPRRRASLPRLAAAVAAGATLLVVGWFAGSTRVGTIPLSDAALSGAAPQPTHILLLRGGSGYRTAPTAAAARARVAEYRDWARGESRAGRLAGGYKLSYEAEVVTVGVEAPPRGEVQGLFLVIAADWETAVDVARDCPHIRYGGTIEVRPIAGG